MVMVALAVATIIVLTFLSGQTTSMAIAHNASRQTQARAIAEDAIDLAMEYIRATPEWRDGFAHGTWSSDQSLNGGTFRVMFEDTADTDLGDDVSEAFRVTVEARFGGVAHRLTSLVTPRGSAAAQAIDVLLVVPNAGSLSADDSSRRALLTSWGYGVQVISEGAGSSEFQDALAANDVVYVSENVSAGSVADNLPSSTIGVVFEQGGLADDLGLSSSYYNYFASYITVANNTHPITEGLPLGHVFVTDSSTHLMAVTGTKASGLQALAQSDYGSYYTKLGVVEAGGALYGGGSAPARRVSLPWGGSSFNFGLLSTDGKKILKNSLIWAAYRPRPQIKSGVVTVGGTPTAVGLTGFTNPVVVCTPNYRNNTRPVVARVSDVTPGGFNVWLENPSGLAVVSDPVHYLVVEAGAHEIDGLRFEAQTYSSSVTDENNSWSGQAQAYLQSYTNPVVVGQVMSANDADWSVFWARGASRTSPPQSSTLYTGKHVGEDTDNTREPETVGFIVFEEGSWEINGYRIDASLSNDSIRGVQGSPPHAASFGQAFSTPPSAAVASLAGMDGSDGGWAILYGSDPLEADRVQVAVDEDQIKDSDRAHTTEQVAVVAVQGSDPSGDAPALVALYDFVQPAPVVPGLVAHWKLDEPSGSAGGVSAGGKIELFNQAQIDSYDASRGGYADQTPGDDAAVSTNRTGTNSVRVLSQAGIRGHVYVGAGGDPDTDTTIQTSSGATVTGNLAALAEDVDLAVPDAGSVGSGSDLTHNGGSHTLDADALYRNWTLNNGAVVTVDGDVTVRVSKKLTLNDGRIIVPSGSSLTLYVKEGVTLNNDSQINPDTSAPDRVLLSVYHSSKGDLVLNSTSSLTARVYTGDDLTLNNSSALYGTAIVGDYLKLSSQAAIHVDRSSPGVLPVVASEEQSGRDGLYLQGAAPGQAGHGDGGTSVRFDGSDDRIEVPHSNAFLLNEGTVSFWFYADSTSGYQGLIAKDATNYGTGGHFRVYLNGSRLECRLQSTTYSNYVYSSSGAVSTGRWHHVAVGFGGQGLRLYLDGVQVDAHHYYGGLGTSSGGAGNHEPWTFGVDQWHADDLSSDGWDDPFDGRIDDVRLYDMNLETDQVGDLVAGDPPGSAASATVHDTADAGLALDLSIANPENISWVSGGGLTIHTATTIASPGTVPRLRDDLEATDRVTLEAEFTPANITQDGPARIVAYSNGTSSRNFKLGQTDAKVNARLRTSLNSSGTPDLEAGDVLTAGTREHVILTYDGEELRLYRDGRLEVAESWTGDLDNWDSAFRLVMGNEIGGSRPWLGTLHRVAIWDGSVNQVQADNLFNGDPPGAPDGGDEGLEFVVEWLENP